MMNCLVCGHAASGKDLSNHVQREHKLKSIDYTIKHIYGGVRPLCLACDKETRYTSWQFKRYCHEHASLAEIEGGKKGGSHEAWNKGKDKHTDPRIASQSQKMIGAANPFFGKKHSEHTKKANAESHRLSEQEITERILSSPYSWELCNYYEYFRRNEYLKFKCKMCDTFYDKKLSDIERGTRCRKCFDVHGTSRAEDEIEAFVSSFDLHVVRNSKKIIPPKEIDIFVPDANVGIEHHGLYWHSRPDRDKMSPYEKWRMADERGVRLIQLFSDEWMYKKDICRSIIANAIHKSTMKMDARKCCVVDVGPDVARTFYERNHIDGFARSRYHIGLHDGDRIISMLSIRRPFHRRHDDCLEVSRFASLLDCNVRGALGKLMSRVVELTRSEGKRKVMTYVDLRIGTGRGYEAVGFVKTSHTGVNYWHTDCDERFNRFMFKADRARGLTERQVCEAAGVVQVYGPGNVSYVIEV